MVKVYTECLGAQVMLSSTYYYLYISINNNNNRVTFNKAPTMTQDPGLVHYMHFLMLILTTIYMVCITDTLQMKWGLIRVKKLSKVPE